MQHKPSAIMTDRDGEFQRCWECGARRRIAALGPGMWDKSILCGPEEEAKTSAIKRNAPRTRQELVDELFKQT